MRVEPAPGSEVRTFFIADVRGYTQFTLDHGDEAAARLTKQFADVVEEVVSALDGAVIELRGDEALAVFTSARQALRAATELQTRMTEPGEPNTGFPMTIGIGLDAGEAIPVKGGYRGAALNLAARLCALAGPGEVLASDGVIHLARRVEGLDYADRGMAQLKGFAEPVRVLAVAPTSSASRLLERTGQLSPALEPATQQPAPGATREGIERHPLPIGGFLGSLPDRVLVARETEVQQILTAIDTVAGGVGRLVLLAGEPGAGKTRLAQEATLHLRDRGFLLAPGRCYETHQDVPLYPFLDALAALYAAAPAAMRAEVPRRWPLLAQLLSEGTLTLEPRSGGREEQERLFRAVGGFISTLADGAGVALLLDDLHWADAASLALFLHLARQTRARQVFLLGTYRDVEVNRQHPLGKALRDMTREHLIEEIAVRRLDRSGTAALVSATFQSAAISEVLADLVHRRTEGNPFYTYEVLRILVDRGDVFEANDHWEQRDLAGIEIPRSVRDAIGERLARLSAEAQDVLQAASVLGQEFGFDDLLSVTELGERDLEARLEEGVEAHVVREAEGEVYTFDHALTQQTVYSELSSRRKRRLHRAAAEALVHLPEGRRDKRVTEIARHYLEADDAEQALPYTLLAGDRAEAVFAHGEGERHYRLAVNLAREISDVAAEAQALEKLGRVLWATARWLEALELLERAAVIYRTGGDQDGEMRVTALIASIAFEGDDPAGAIARVRALLSKLEEHAPTRAMAELSIVLASGLTYEERLDEALEAAEQAAAIARELEDDGLAAAAEGRRGFVLLARGDWEAARSVLHRAAALAEAAGDFDTLLRALHNLGASEDDLEAKVGYLRRAVQVAEILNDPAGLNLSVASMLDLGSRRKLEWS